jgi:hypothetical protein
VTSAAGKGAVVGGSIAKDQRAENCLGGANHDRTAGIGRDEATGVSARQDGRARKGAFLRSAAFGVDRGLRTVSTTDAALARKPVAGS